MTSEGQFQWSDGKQKPVCIGLRGDSDRKEQRFRRSLVTKEQGGSGDQRARRYGAGAVKNRVEGDQFYWG